VKVLARPAVRDMLTQQGMDIVASTPEAFAKFVSGEMKRWGKVVRDTKTKAGE
jgi:tripartite-type tricarboxylate transporter receptor subunit TctC